MDRLSFRTRRRKRDRSTVDFADGRRRSGEIHATTKGSVEDFAWAPDSKRIVLVVQDPDPREPEKKEKEKKTVPPIVIDRFQFKQDIDGYLTNRYSHLELLDLTSVNWSRLLLANTTMCSRRGRRRERRSPL